ncbi:hypothetical protein [Lactobacillus sp. LL6]|uniref:hypothetical protein n=1 Tax=Lactobacillus sp. LL6 TaxID=2596827 RepID=UPI0011853AB2|nr:hypothetical protein [Lactobacillus sp. LL6]TSO25263.1 hypothetical protein FOD82_08470 [Lactobacillus sp. LL6]
MVKNGQIIRNLTFGLTSVLAGMLIANMNKEKVEAKENTKSNSADEYTNSNYRMQKGSVKNINKVVVQADTALSKNDQDYVADPSLKMIGLNGLKEK